MPTTRTVGHDERQAGIASANRALGTYTERLTNARATLDETACTYADKVARLAAAASSNDPVAREAVEDALRPERDAYLKARSDVEVLEISVTTVNAKIAALSA